MGVFRHGCGVRRVRSMMVVVLALLWGPLMAHCDWSSLPGLEIFRCEASAADSHESAGGGPESDGRCCDERFCAVESNAYLPANPHPEFVLPPVEIDRVPAWQAVPRVSPEARDVDPPASGPPELPRSWHFLARAALPVRAPSPAA